MRLIDADKLKEKKEYSEERHEYIVSVAQIDWQPTIQPQGIDKDRLIEEISNGYEQEVGKLKMISVDKAVKIINQQPTSDGWIPVSERIPEDTYDVLVFYEFETQEEFPRLVQKIGIGWVHRGKFSNVVNDAVGWRKLRIIAWQPLPPAYKEGE